MTTIEQADEAVRKAEQMLAEAKAARASLDRPRLMTPEERANVGFGPYVGTAVEFAKHHAKHAIEADRADIIAKAERLIIKSNGYAMLVTMPPFTADKQPVIGWDDFQKLMRGEG